MHAGSPPHTRGIRFYSKSLLKHLGFTPAYAGNTRRVVPREGHVKVHPRIRGEYTASRRRGCRLPGSPPHTRGIRPFLIVSHALLGFTPAYAGNTIVDNLTTGIDKVHPRIRGEYAASRTSGTLAVGSPPHTRGILSVCKYYKGVLRFTPAYAGNTKDYKTLEKAQKVHPRIRGEYPGLYRLCHKAGGSPPHTRGIQFFQRLFLVQGRFTPAYAGNTTVDAQAEQGQQVHPRIRGEYQKYYDLHRRLMGSPPHTRGIPGVGEVSLTVDRFTPAYAGNTLTARILLFRRRVHPRIRGEYKASAGSHA